MAHSKLTLDEINVANRRVRGHIHDTPLSYQSTLSDLIGAPLYFKLENMQKTGSFKLRGALNKLGLLQEEGKMETVVAASAGNHAQGVAWAARELGFKSLIVMPKGAAVSKVAATKSYGAQVLLQGDTFDDAHEIALKLAGEKDMTFIPAFDDVAVAAGQGTLGLELVDELPNVGTVIVPIGGGGLIAGMLVAIKEKRPGVRVVGVEAQGAASFHESLKSTHGSRTTLDEVQTIADGIAVKAPGDLTYPVVKRYVDDVVCVSDDEIAGAILYFMERLKLVVEGAGAVGLAALLAGRIDRIGPDPVIGVVSGGNIDVDVIARIIEKGLVRSGRRLQLRVLLPDRPGALHGFSGIIADMQANILGIDHDRSSTRVPMGRTEVILSVAVHDVAHGRRLVDRLEVSGYKVNTDLMDDEGDIGVGRGPAADALYGFFEGPESVDG